MKKNVLLIRTFVLILLGITVCYGNTIDSTSSDLKPSKKRIVAQYGCGTANLFIGALAGWAIEGSEDGYFGSLVGGTLGLAIAVKLIGDFHRDKKGSYESTLLGGAVGLGSGMLLGIALQNPIPNLILPQAGAIYGYWKSTKHSEAKVLIKP